MKNKKTSTDLFLSRRSMLKAGCGFLGSSLLGGMSFKAFAQAASFAPPDRCFVFAYLAGGWDQLLAFDPRNPTVFTPDRLAETRILPGYDLLTDNSFPKQVVVPPTRAGAAPSNITFGPAIGRLADHYDQMLVVRGINMTTLAHEVGYRYFLTGKAPAGSAPRGSSVATEIVGQMAPRVPIPNLAYNIESYNERFNGAASALGVNRISDLLLALSPSPIALDSEIEKALVDFRGNPVSCESQLYDSRGLVTQYGESQTQVRTTLESRLDNLFRFERAENAAVRAQYGLASSGSYDNPGGRAALAATAIKQGLTQCVSVNLVGGLDTHFGTQQTHATALRSGFNALGDLVSDLRASAHPGGGTFLDHTTVVVFSEFARTPLINSAGGRDHHLTSSCALIGAGVKHNRVIGYSGDIQMSPGRVDFLTGEPKQDGLNILPEHVLASVLASAGLSTAELRTGPIPAMLA